MHESLELGKFFLHKTLDYKLVNIINRVKSLSFLLILLKSYNGQDLSGLPRMVTSIRITKNGNTHQHYQGW